MNVPAAMVVVVGSAPTHKAPSSAAVAVASGSTLTAEDVTVRKLLPYTNRMYRVSLFTF